MAGIPDENISEALKRQLEANQVKKNSKVGCGILVLFLLIAFAASAVGPYVDYLWFLNDVREPQVFFTGIQSKSLLFTLSFFPIWGFLWWTWARALGQSMVFASQPSDAASMAAANFLAFLQRSGSVFVRIAAPVVAFLSALSFSNEWLTMQMARNAVPFGMKDPTFGLDLGFFVFQFPWWRALSNLGFAVVLVGGLGTLAIYLGLTSIAALAKAEMGRPAIRAHLALLISLGLITLAITQGLQSLEVGFAQNAQFTGAGLSLSYAFVGQRIFAGVLLLVAILVLLASRSANVYRIATTGVVVALTVYVIGIMVVPSFVQRVVVAPQLASKEGPFAAHAIKMTRYAYGIDKFEFRNFDDKPEPQPAQVSASRSTLDNMRLWDPEVLRTSLESTQALRRYYAFEDVDLDRYRLNGRQTMVMIAARDIDTDGLDPSARNWNNLRLRFTHGYGVAMSQVNASTADGQPKLLMRDVPLETPPDLKVDRPQVYFGDRRTRFNAADYVIVGAKEDEFSYQTSARTVTHRWTGNRGIPIGGFFRRLLLAAEFGDGSLLVASNIEGNSRLLMRRDISERAARVFPFLRFDQDPYIVIHDGKLKWILDGYTATDRIPYAEMLRGATGNANYLRNSVKVVIDAYTGETTGYAVDEADPLLKAFRKIYPNLIEDRSKVPAGLDAHFRYAEDLLTIQSRVLAQYHVTDPGVFLSNGDAWEVANERDTTGNKAAIRPYYVQMRLPDEASDGFMQILPFTARQKPNMSGWLAAHCDPDNYGRVVVYRFTSNDPPPGPELMETNFNSNPDIANINRTFNNDQSEIIVGNLLVVPLGDSVLYVEPLFLRSRTSGLMTAPRLFRVILALQNRIVVRDTYDAALRDLFGTEVPDEATRAVTAPGQPTPPVRVPTASEALQVFEQGEAALKQGDFAKYGEAQRRLKALLQQLARERAAAAGATSR